MKNSKLKSIWEGVRAVLVGRGVKIFVEWIIISTVKNELLQETYLLLLEPLQEGTKIMTDDDKDNSAQLEEYLVEKGNLKRLIRELGVLAEKLEEFKK